LPLETVKQICSVLNVAIENSIELQNYVLNTGSEPLRLRQQRELKAYQNDELEASQLLSFLISEFHVLSKKV
jgi:hypothetical protein